MRILHTADIHLREVEDERWKTLEKIVEIGRKEKVSFLIISGDLFDRGFDAERLRPKIRKILSGNGFEVLIIPGNHDRDSFKTGLFFGEDTRILSDPFMPFETENVRIFGLPFEQIEGEQLISRLASLKNLMIGNKKNILLCHGELLDSFFSRRDFGDEGTDRYMPFWLWYFNDLPVDYVLCGHFHTRLDIRKLDKGGYFVYPGSPLSITRKEVGQRRLNMFEVGSEPREHPIDSYHYEILEVELDPFSTENQLDDLRMRINILHPEARLVLRVSGYFDSRQIGMTESGLQFKIKELSERKIIEMNFEVRDIQEIIGDDLYKDFLNEVEKRNLDVETKKSLKELVIRAMIEARK